MMIAQKLLSCTAKAAAQNGFLATWDDSTMNASIGTVYSGPAGATGNGTIVVPAGSDQYCTIASTVPIGQNAWVVDMFFLVDGANLAPPIFFVLVTGQNGPRTLASMYQGTLSVGGNSIATPSMSAGWHHLAIGRQSGNYSAWIDGAMVIDAAAPPEYPGKISLLMYGSGGSTTATSYPCEWGDVRATAAELYSGATISVPTLPLVAA